MNLGRISITLYNSRNRNSWIYRITTDLNKDIWNGHNEHPNTENKLSVKQLLVLCEKPIGNGVKQNQYSIHAVITYM